MKTAYTRTAAIVLAFAFGASFPAAHVLAFLIRWLVMFMLFIVFLNTRLGGLGVRRSHLVLLAANFAVGLSCWSAGMLSGDRNIALALFFAGITPTATAAPVIISFLRGRVDYVVTSFLLSNVLVAASMPILLPLVLGHATGPIFGAVMGSVTLVVFVPMALARLLRAVHPAAEGWPPRLRNVSFAVWVSTLFLVTSNASHFLRSQEHLPWRQILLIAGFTVLICALNFSLGRLIGRPHFRREASQSLGQKNTTFTIYLALTYANPLVALGPTFYVLWHNVWNSWQLHAAAVREGRTLSSAATQPGPDEPDSGPSRRSTSLLQ